MAPFRFLMGLAFAAMTVQIFAGPDLARAQDENPTTPGAIPNPGTYQGSQTLQQQSDAQDQAFRAQQQQPQQQYYQNAQPQQQYYQGAQPQQGYSPGGSRQPVPPAKLSSDPAVAAYQRGDYATAFRLARPRALSGNAVWEAKLGYLYERGLGVPRNSALAVSWYRKAADHGDAGAQTNLGYMLFLGQGVPLDRIEGYKWLLLGGRQSVHARLLMQQFRPSLTYEEMSEATRRYGMWRPVKSATPPPAASRP
jgi:Sel1 repeat